MATEYFHAVSSAQKWGGEPADYLPVHEFFDSSKDSFCDFRHRALYHHAEGIALMERLLGPTLTISTGRVIPTRWVGEQHVKEDCRGRIPSLADWLRCLKPEPWMSPAGKLDAELVHPTTPPSQP